MIEIKRYGNTDRSDWDQFIARTRIDSFLFYRDFMEYHSDRFFDFSFMIYRKGKLEAILPGNRDESVYYSHQGLTYGGLITSRKLTTIDVLTVFKSINDVLKKNGVKEVIYKPIPQMYTNYPAQEDLYALYQLGAEKIGCNISSAIWQDNKIPFVESRKSGIRKAKRDSVSINESTDLKAFWKVLENNLLTSHGKKPVHSLEEITRLNSLFPDQIKLYTASIGNTVIGGCLLFVMNQIVHVQYISANESGKESGAIDLLFDVLINHYYKHIPVFDFGQSTEQMGKKLNNKLIFQKEGFGGRGIVYEIYRYKIS